jgi:hypothetical protein
MKVFIRAHSPVGLAQVTRAGRFWASGATNEVEVVDLKEGETEPTVKVPDPNNPNVMVDRPDPRRISRASFEAIQKDARFSILSDPKEIEAAGELEAENKRLRARVAELEAAQGQGQAVHAGAHGHAPGEATHPGGEDDTAPGRRTSRSGK